MKTTTFNFVRIALIGFAALVLVGATFGTARADEVTITGSTTGSVTGAPQLTFSGTDFFTGTTALGIGSLSGSNSLGSFFLSTAPTQSLIGSFTMNVTFTAPTGISGGQGASHTAIPFCSGSPHRQQRGGKGYLQKSA